MSEPQRCINHPDRETLLRCGKCGRSICTECAVRHPVGLRCAECAQLRKVPAYDVPPSYYPRAFGAGLVTSLLCGIIAEILPLFLPIFMVSFFLALVAGAIIGEAISRATRYKRGRGLQVVAAACAVLGSLAATLAVAAFRYGAATVLILPAFLLNPLYWLYPIVAAAVAAMRLR
jgi:hypothetical protein